MIKETNDYRNIAKKTSCDIAKGCDIFKGKFATLKEDFIPESENGHWETGYWHLKKGTKVYIEGNESDGTCYINYIDAVFEIDCSRLNII